MEKIEQEFAVPVFKCGVEKIHLTNIIKFKKIIAITIKYKNREKKVVQKTIEDDGGIDIVYSDTDIIVIRINNQQAFQEIEEDSQGSSIYNGLENSYNF